MAGRKRATQPGRVYGGESAAERLAKQRAQFMAAGLQLFGTVGYRATTVRMLCKEAGLIDRYFYKNFEDTEALLAAVYTEALDQIAAKVVKVVTPTLGSRDPYRAVELGLDAFFEAFEDARAARVCWLEVLGVSPRIDALYTRRIQQFADLLLSVGQQVLPKSTLQGLEGRITAIALIGAISESALFWLLSDYEADRKLLVSATAQVLRGTAGSLLATRKARKARPRTARSTNP